MAQAILLGNAQDGGVPQAGCACPTCAAAWASPRARRAVSSLGLIDHAAACSFLIDATPDLPAQLHRLHQLAPAALLAGILLTHAHVGHYTGLIHLGREVMNASGVPVFASERMGAFLRAHAPWRQLVESGNIALRELTPDAELRLSESLWITPLAVPHRAEWSDTLAFVVRGPKRRLLYLPDIDRWSEWDRPLRDLVESLDVALLDGTFLSPDELPGRDLTQVPHPLVRETAARLQGVTCDVRFIHLNHSNPLLRPGPPRAWLESLGFRVGEAGDAWEL